MDKCFAKCQISIREVIRAHQGFPSLGISEAPPRPPGTLFVFVRDYVLMLRDVGFTVPFFHSERCLRLLGCVNITPQSNTRFNNMGCRLHIAVEAMEG